MSPADIVISRFGGVRALARLLKKDPSTISRWRQPKQRGGTDGLVPSSAQVELLALAQKQGVKLSACELVLGSHCEDDAAVSTPSSPKSKG